MRQFAIGLAYFSLLVVVVSMVRRRKISEGQALRWIGGILVFAVLTIIPLTLDSVASALGIVEPTNLILGAGLYVLALVALQQQSEISTLQDEHRQLVQEVAILELDNRDP